MRKTLLAAFLTGPIFGGAPLWIASIGLILSTRLRSAFRAVERRALLCASATLTASLPLAAGAYILMPALGPVVLAFGAYRYHILVMRVALARPRAKQLTKVNS